MRVGPTGRQAHSSQAEGGVLRNQGVFTSFRVAPQNWFVGCGQESELTALLQCRQFDVSTFIISV